MDDTKKHDDPANRDPITGEPGAHPLGVGVGAAAGGMAAGAAAGTVAGGPIGTVVGAALGAVVGGLGGKAVAEHFDPTVEADYWRENHASQSYDTEGQGYDAYEPAYRLAAATRGSKYANRSFDDVEPNLRQDYESARGETHVDWERAKHAARAAWDRVSAGT